MTRPPLVSPAYRSQSELDADVAAALERGGARVHHEVIGRSVEGRDLVAVRVAAAGRRPDPARPAAMVMAAMHGIEVVASELAVAVLDEAVDRPDDPFVAELLELADLVVVPSVNPDSRAAAVASLDRNRLWNPARRRNARGVDLNRNFPLARGAGVSRLPIAGTDRAWLPWYRGPHPLSEPESAAIAGLARRIRPVGLLDLHSTGRFLLYPWASRPDPCPDVDAFEAVTGAFCRAQSHVRYRPRLSYGWYPTAGGVDEWIYDELGSLSLTVELAPVVPGVRVDWRRWRWAFWWANPIDPGAEIDATRSACFASLAEAARRHRDGRVRIRPSADG